MESYERECYYMRLAMERHVFACEINAVLLVDVKIPLVEWSGFETSLEFGGGEVRLKELGRRGSQVAKQGTYQIQQHSFH